VATTSLFLKRHPEFAALIRKEGQVPCWSKVLMQFDGHMGSSEAMIDW
jgi:hypothetical protein